MYCSHLALQLALEDFMKDRYSPFHGNLKDLHLDVMKKTVNEMIDKASAKICKLEEENNAQKK